MLWSTANWEKATAPIAANAVVHNETSPAVRTSRPRARNRMICVSALVQNESLTSTTCGTRARAMTTAAPTE